MQGYTYSVAQRKHRFIEHARLAFISGFRTARLAHSKHTNLALISCSRLRGSHIPTCEARIHIMLSTTRLAHSNRTIGTNHGVRWPKIYLCELQLSCTRNAGTNTYAWLPSLSVGMQMCHWVVACQRAPRTHSAARRSHQYARHHKIRPLLQRRICSDGAHRMCR